MSFEPDMLYMSLFEMAFFLFPFIDTLNGIDSMFTSSRLNCFRNSFIITCPSSSWETLFAPSVIIYYVMMYIGLLSCSFVLVKDNIYFLHKLSSDILYSLKPISACSKHLIGNIFGFSNVNTSAQPMPCFHSNGSCLIDSECL